MHVGDGTPWSGECVYTQLLLSVSVLACEWFYHLTSSNVTKMLFCFILPLFLVLLRCFLNGFLEGE